MEILKKKFRQVWFFWIWNSIRKRKLKSNAIKIIFKRWGQVLQILKFPTLCKDSRERLLRSNSYKKCSARHLLQLIDRKDWRIYKPIKNECFLFLHTFFASFERSSSKTRRNKNEFIFFYESATFHKRFPILELKLGKTSFYGTKNFQVLSYHLHLTPGLSTFIVHIILCGKILKTKKSSKNSFIQWLIFFEKKCCFLNRQILNNFSVLNRTQDEME